MMAAVGQGPESLLGQRLVRAGLLRRDELTQALSRQSYELICEGLRMPSGQFEFERTRQLPASALSEDLVVRSRSIRRRFCWKGCGGSTTGDGLNKMWPKARST